MSTTQPEITATVVAWEIKAGVTTIGSIWDHYWMPEGQRYFATGEARGTFATYDEAVHFLTQVFLSEQAAA